MIYAVLQAVVVTAIVAFCAVQMMRRMLPKLSHDLQVKGAKLLGRELAPVKVQDSGCGSGCGSCKGCSVSFEIKKG
jgi:hypothetical protein